MRKLWDQMNTLGPKYGYFTNASKTWLVTKKNCHSSAVAVFAETDVKVTSDGRPYLGVALGTGVHAGLVTDKVHQWAGELEQLAIIARSQPMLLMQFYSWYD